MSILNVVKRTAIISAVFCSAPFKRTLMFIHTLRRTKKQVRRTIASMGLWPVALLHRSIIDQKKTNWNCSWRRMGRLFSYQSSSATAGPKFTL